MHALGHSSTSYEGGANALVLYILYSLAIEVYCLSPFLLIGMQVQARESASVVTTAGVTRAAVSALSVVS